MSKLPKGKRLTNKMEMFCQEYVIDFNGTQSAIRAGYSKRTAASVSAENLSKPAIQQRIKELMNKAQKIIEVTHQEVLQRLKDWAESDITETIGLTPEEVKELPKNIRQLITKYKHTSQNFTDKEGNIYEIREIIELHFVSKEKAIELLSRHIGFFEKDNEQKSIPVRQIVDMSTYKNKIND